MSPCRIAIVLVGTTTCLSCSKSGSNDPLSIRPDVKDPDAVVLALEETIKYLKAFECDLQMAIHIQADGMDNRMTSEYSVRVEKPRRWAIVMDSGMLGGTSVSDGRQVVNYLAMLQQYSIHDLPENWSDVRPTSGPAESFAMMGPSGSASLFMGNGLADFLLGGSAEVSHVGTEMIDGVSCGRYSITRKDGTWDLWVQIEPQVLIRKLMIRPDLSSTPMPMGDSLKDMKMEAELVFTNWQTTPEFADADFAFNPPAGASKVDSLFSMGGGEQPPHALLGEPAPAFQLKDLSGNMIELESYLGEEVVVLDFWATWCGPCTAALPDLAQVAADFAGRGVNVYAVNVGEEAELVQEFMESQGLLLSVLLDQDSSVSSAYMVQGIPMTVIIGKDKRVQAIHEGYNPEMLQIISDELTSVLAGEDLATETLNEWEEDSSQAASSPEGGERRGLTPAWSLRGRYTGVAFDNQSEELCALEANGKLRIISRTGDIQSEVQLAKYGSVLRLGNLLGSPKAEFVTTSTWSGDIYACSREGELLWSYPRESGVDDVWCADLDGNGIDEVIVGYNGGGGLHVLDSRGTLLWKTTGIGNVWHVTAGEFLGDGQVQVVSTSARGDLHVFSHDGQSENTIKVNIYANMVRMISLPDEPTSLALVGGSGEGETLLLVDKLGKERWKCVLPTMGTDHIDSLDANSALSWAAVGVRGGLAHVVDVVSGEIIASADQQGNAPEVALSSAAKSAPLLLVATGDRLNAFAVEPEPSNDVHQADQE